MAVRTAPTQARRRRTLGALVALAAAAAVLASCIPMPPNSYVAGQFPNGEGPNVVRAETFMGLGAWWDVYDWSPTFTNGAARLGVADVDRLAAAGVQTLYIQTATFRHPATVLDVTRLKAIIARAKTKKVKVVGWYLPQFLDVSADLTRMVAAVRLGLDGYAIDIESTDNPNVAARSQMLVNEMRFLRGGFPNLPLAAVPVTAVIWDELNRSWWPSFPYKELARWCDVWMPMAYWTYRPAGSTWRDPYRYVSESVTRLRTSTGVPWLPVHPIGGLSSLMSTADADAMNRAMTDTYAIGGSLYDDVSTPAGLWPSLRQFRRT